MKIGMACDHGAYTYPSLTVEKVKSARKPLFKV